MKEHYVQNAVFSSAFKETYSRNQQGPEIVNTIVSRNSMTSMYKANYITGVFVLENLLIK